MSILASISKAAGLAVIASCIAAAPALAGPIFLTGHDPDFHAQPGAGSPGAGNLLRTGLSFATGGTYNGGVAKFLWVESNIGSGGPGIPGGHLRGENGLVAIGLTRGVHYDWADAVAFGSVDLSLYSAIGIASTFGGTLTQAEINAMIARKSDIETFINAGGGLFASAECTPCGVNLATDSTSLFGFLPVTVTSIGANPPFTVTPFGAGLGLTDADVNDPTHNSFGLVGGLNVVDTDSSGNATTLAGIVRIRDGGFESEVPAPATALLFGSALALLCLRRRAA